MKLRSAVSVAVLSLLLTACAQSASTSSSGDDVRLAVEPADVAPGDSVTLVLTNESGATVGYNLCTSALQRLTEGEWRAVSSNRACTMELRMIQSGGDARFGLRLPVGLEPGEYRFRTDVERPGTDTLVAVASPSFDLGS